MAQCAHWLARLEQLHRQHPKRILAGVAALLMVGAGGSYAVATLGPDAAALPTREVVEAVQPLPFAVTDMAPQALRLYRSEITRSNDTAESLLRRLGISDSTAEIGRAHV